MIHKGAEQAHAPGCSRKARNQDSCRALPDLCSTRGLPRRSCWAGVADPGAHRGVPAESGNRSASSTRRPRRTWNAISAALYALRQRKGITAIEGCGSGCCNATSSDRMMVQAGDADALVSGLTQHYPDTIRPAPARDQRARRIAQSLRRVTCSSRPRAHLYFLADCTVNIEPSAEDLAEIAICTPKWRAAQRRPARCDAIVLDSSAARGIPLADKVRRAVELVRRGSRPVRGWRSADTCGGSRDPRGDVSVQRAEGEAAQRAGLPQSGSRGKISPTSCWRASGAAK